VDNLIPISEWVRPPDAPGAQGVQRIRSLLQPVRKVGASSPAWRVRPVMDQVLVSLDPTIF